MPSRNVVYVIPHTHWDREWYEPFEGYRIRLVRVVDEILEVLENDPAFHFHFDGQTAAIEDYLAVRPGAEPRVRALVSAGKLAVGPWRILMDEFLCSPETIVRNMRQGLATARALGADPRIGYIPDSFGHIAQMPQILSLYGMNAALVWRGVPFEVDRPLFEWEAPDGTLLRTMYLATSYSNGATLPHAFEELMVRAKRIVEDMAPFQPAGPVLAMCGSDHLAPQPHLTSLFADANDRQDEIELRLGSLAGYLASQPETGWPRRRGEMRSSARANLLMGVLSARMPLKQGEQKASTLLERYAEPLSALAGYDGGGMLNEAWRWMVENSAHDSVCGCGVDAVATDVGSRYAKAARIGDAVAGEALSMLAATIACRGDGDGVVLFNPSPFGRHEIVEATLPLPAAASGIELGDGHRMQALDEIRQVVVDMTITGTELARIVPTIHSRQLGTLYVNRMELVPGRVRTVTLDMDTVPAGEFDVEAAKRDVEAAALAAPRGKFRVIGEGPPLVRALIDAAGVAGLGWTAMFPRAASGPAPQPAVFARGNEISNGLLSVTVDEAGRSTIRRAGSTAELSGIGLVDVADAGDEYTYSPPPNDTSVDTASSSETPVASAGPLQARLVSRQRWRIPAEIDPSRRKRVRRTVEMPVEIEWALRAREPFARLTIRIDNSARDHRLRLRIPLGFPAAASDADGAFTVEHRGLEAEGAPHEYPTPSFPARRWVDVSGGEPPAGIAVVHEGTPEYEIANRALEVTLLRCVGWLSRQDCSRRSGPAGPMLEAPGAQLPGKHEMRFALYPHDGDWRDGSVPRVAERFLYPFRSAVVRAHDGSLPPAGGALSVEPASVVLSAVERRGDGTHIRFYNSAAIPVDARIRLGAPLHAGGAQRIGLDGRDLGPVVTENETLLMPLRSFEIATIRFP